MGEQTTTAIASALASLKYDNYSYAGTSGITSNCTNTANSAYTISSAYDDLVLRINQLHSKKEMKDFTNYLREEELLPILKIVEERQPTEFQDIIQGLVSNRHFSENFLCEFLSYLPKDVLYEMHKAEILSHEYERVALALEVKEN